MNYLFPAAIMSTTFALTGLMIVLGLAGKSDAAADVGIVYAVTVALFNSFSGNARSIILNPSSGVPIASILSVRLLLLLPLGALSFLLSTNLAGVEVLLAFVLVLRRGMEWVAEVYLCRMEQRDEKKPTLIFLALQIILTWSVFVWMLADLPFLLLVMLVWATSPIWISAKFILECVHSHPLTRGTYLRQFPHFGSTAVIGISVYVFRLLILLVAGKTIAGDLYSAFAIGGFLGSVFAQAIGPTLVLQEARRSVTGFPIWLKAAIMLSLLSGVTLFVMANVRPEQLLWTGKSGFFWTAAGLSLIGGAVMVAAQHVRLRLLQHPITRDVFGPDVLVNILIVGSVPYFFYLFGMGSLAYLFLVSSLLGMIFYYSAEKSENLWADKIPSWDQPMRAAIALLLLTPIFFQVNGAIFRDPRYVFDTGGLLNRLPIPISVLACYGGIMLLGGYRRARLSFATIFFTFTLMLMSSIVLAHDQSNLQKAKLILLIQLVLPMFALVLGQLFGAKHGMKSLLAKTFFYVLIALVPAQLAATWLSGQLLLSPYLYLFSVYQHLQYVPLVCVISYLVSLCSLWSLQRYRLALQALGALISIYAVSALSSGAMGSLVFGVLGFATYEKVRGRGTMNVLVLCVLVLISTFGFLWFAKNSKIFVVKFGEVYSAQLGANMKVPRNMAERITYWKFYAEEVFDSPKNAVWGHVRPPDRTQYPSAHNYYLDFAYNFGVVALLPLFGLMTFTLFRMYQNWKTIVVSSSLLGLTTVVPILVLVDNSFKVGMRQPYPGIFTFFLWGVLLTKLDRKSLSTGSLRPE